MSKTAKTRKSNKRPVGGRGKITPAQGTSTRFSSQNQPTPEAKSLGKQKVKLLKDLLAAAFKGPKGGRIKKMAASYLGIPEDELTVEDMLHYRQIERAISKSNTFAYQAVLDRAYGKPKQPIEDSSPKKIVVTIKKNAS